MNNQEMSIREVQLSCIDMVRAFDAFCRENGITYYLSGGTMLGAIRHKGFIPWDDDVDIMLPRADYEKLLSLGFEHEHFRFYHLKNTPDYARPWGRITDTRTEQVSQVYFKGDTRAVFIDVMPIDGLPESDFITKLHYMRMRFLDALNKGAKRNFIEEKERLAFLKRLTMKLIGVKGARRIAVRIDKLAGKRPFEGSAYRGVSVVSHYGVKEKLKAEVFAENIDVEFEGMQLMLFAGYESYLKNIYGDYMQLPPEEKRVITHRTRYRRVEEN